jgi:hypothetical protein
MGAIAKRFVLRLTAAAQTDGGSSRQIEGFPLSIVNRKLAFDLDRPIIVDYDFR